MSKEMDCNHCGEHIIATTSVSWNRGQYHDSCIGDAVATYRAEKEVPLTAAILPDDYFDQLEESDEFLDDELDGLDDIIDRFDQAEVDDEFLNQMPIMSSNGHERNVIVPEVMPGLMTIESPKVNATLMAHKGAQYVSREVLPFLQLPEETDTFQPIAHHLLINEIEESLAYRHIKIERSEFAVSPDGMKLFGLLEVSAGMDGIRFAIGLRNSNDKSMRLGMVAGYRVFVCDNMALSGDFKPMLAKHTKNFDLTESISIGIDRVQRFFKPMKHNILTMKNINLRDNEAIEFIYNSFMDYKFPISLIKEVHKQYFEPEIEDFKTSNVWSLSNAYTSAFKKLNPVSRYEQTARIGRLIAETYIPS